jgi:hypothetical protein
MPRSDEGDEKVEDGRRRKKVADGKMKIPEENGKKEEEGIGIWQRKRSRFPVLGKNASFYLLCLCGHKGTAVFCVLGKGKGKKIYDGMGQRRGGGKEA